MTASSRRPAPPAGPFEQAAWLAGAALICVYLGAHLWLWRDRASALADFDVQQIAQQMNARPDAGQARPHDEARHTPASLVVREPPDTSTWSANRLAAFAAAAHDRAAPAAILRIDAVDLEVPVYEGASERNLNRGAAWIEGTAAPGQRGNVGLAAHRDGYFRALKDVQVGDRIEIATPRDRLHYRIVDLRIVAPDAIEVLAPTPYDAVTLVTCHPFYFVGPAPQRFIVRAERI